MESVQDPLVDVFTALNVRAGSLSGIDAAGRWGLRLDAHEHLKIGVVLTGSCVVAANGGPCVRLSAGDCFLLVAHQWFQVADKPGTPLDDGHRIFRESGTRVVRIDGSGSGTVPDPATERTVVIGSSVHFLDRTVAGLLAGLPVLTAIRAGTGPARAIRPLLRLCMDEVDLARIGAPAMIERLAEMLFIQAVRALVEEPGDVQLQGWLGALRDPQIGGALVLMHRQSARRWTVAELGGAVGMSRAAFASRFKQMVGTPPLEYLSRWRMVTAGRELLAGDRTVASVAADLGYTSEAAFSAAFKRIVGVAPGRYRNDPMAAAPPLGGVGKVAKVVSVSPYAESSADDHASFVDG